MLAMTILIPPNAQLIAVSATNHMYAAGWMGSLSDGSVVTDESWKCSPEYSPNWFAIDFNDNH